MGRELFEHNACFRAAMQRADRMVVDRCGESVLAALFADGHARDIPFDRLLLSHPAIFMVEYALAKALFESGTRPDMVLGTSLGAFAAAAIAGCIDPDAALLAVIEQAIALEAHAERGYMIAVMSAQERFFTPELSVLCELGARNFTNHSVLSLPESNLSAVEAWLRQCGVAFQRLPVNVPFHSRWIEPARKPYEDFLHTLPLRLGKIPIVCCATSMVFDTLPANYLWSVVRDRVLFQRAINVIESRDSYRYVDVGPGGTMATFLKYVLPAESKSRVHQIMSPFGGDVNRLIELARTSSPETRQVKHGMDPAVCGYQDKLNAGRSIVKSHSLKATIFPGQGSQFKGMGKDVFPLFPELVESASGILGYSLEDLCLGDAQGRLSQTQYTQPALFAVNAMHYFRQRDLQGAADAGLKPDFFAGHSLGEYNALLAAGVFSFETGLRLVKKRGELMGAANGGGMAAVLGVPAGEVRAILDGNGFDEIDIANLNTPTQTVIAGAKKLLVAAVDLFAQRDLRCVILNVSAAFHSRQMQVVQAEFSRFLRQFTFEVPSVTVIANATARPYDSTCIAETLARQIASPVQWVDSIRYLMGRGDIEFQEIGASVLSKMVREIQARETPIVDDAPSGTLVDTKTAATLAVVAAAKRVEAADQGGVATANIASPQLDASTLGSAVFRHRFGLKYAYMAGAMYRGVASAELVIKMGQAGLLSFFGAGGLSPAKIEANLVRIQHELNAGQPYGMNLLANYEYPALEETVIDLYLKHGVKNIEAAAFMQMTPALIKFRLRGLRVNAQNEIVCDHRIVAKVSRPEVARAFMSPPPVAIVDKLLERGQITPEQAGLAQRIPVSHDICVEADSGGHTDGGIAAVMLPPLLRMRDEMQRTHHYAELICMGLAGGIGGPEAAAAAFMLGADFVMTGSINQCTVEAGMSDDGKSMLQEIDIHDTEYAPAGDMFEIGAQVQVMKKSVFFPARANKLLSLYRHYDSLNDIPERTRNQLEKTFFKKTFDEIWQETSSYFESEGLTHEIAKAEANAKHKMALVFRWYFARCTRIALEGKGDDRVNYQIQTGPALGSFNQWVKGTELEPWTRRHVDHIAIKLMDSTAEHLAKSFSRMLSS